MKDPGSAAAVGCAMTLQCHACIGVMQLVCYFLQTCHAGLLRYVQLQRGNEMTGDATSSNGLIATVPEQVSQQVCPIVHTIAPV